MTAKKKDAPRRLEPPKITALVWSTLDFETGEPLAEELRMAKAVCEAIMGQHEQEVNRCGCYVITPLILDGYGIDGIGNMSDAFKALTWIGQLKFDAGLDGDKFVYNSAFLLMYPALDTEYHTFAFKAKEIRALHAALTLWDYYRSIRDEIDGKVTE